MSGHAQFNFESIVVAGQDDETSGSSGRIRAPATIAALHREERPLHLQINTPPLLDSQPLAQHVQSLQQQLQEYVDALPAATGMPSVRGLTVVSPCVAALDDTVGNLVARLPNLRELMLGCVCLRDDDDEEATSRGQGYLGQWTMRVYHAHSYCGLARTVLASCANLAHLTHLDMSHVAIVTPEEDVSALVDAVCGLRHLGTLRLRRRLDLKDLKKLCASLHGLSDLSVPGLSFNKHSSLERAPHKAILKQFRFPSIQDLSHPAHVGVLTDGNTMIVPTYLSLPDWILPCFPNLHRATGVIVHVTDGAEVSDAARAGLACLSSWDATSAWVLGGAVVEGLLQRDTELKGVSRVMFESTYTYTHKLEDSEEARTRFAELLPDLRILELHELDDLFLMPAWLPQAAPRLERLVLRNYSQAWNPTWPGCTSPTSALRGVLLAVTSAASPANLACIQVVLQMKRESHTWSHCYAAKLKGLVQEADQANARLAHAGSALRVEVHRALHELF
jgi:hypothetical protein